MTSTMKLPTPRMTDGWRAWLRTFTRTVESFLGWPRKCTGSGWKHTLTLLDLQLEEYKQTLNEDLNRVVWQVPPAIVPLRTDGIDPSLVRASILVAFPQTRPWRPQEDHEA